MTKHKIHPRLINPGAGAPHNYFFRLVSSQRFLAIIGLAFLVIIMFPLAKSYSQRRLVEKEIAEVKNQISDYESQNEQLKELIEYLKSDQSLEEQARLNLNLKKPGEAVIVVENKKTGATEAAAASDAIPESNPAKWRRYFFE